jgi:hypothetical protein
MDLSNEEMQIYNLYSSIYILRRIRWVGHIAGMEEIRNAYIILVANREGKRPSRR